MNKKAKIFAIPLMALAITAPSASALGGGFVGAYADGEEISQESELISSEQESPTDPQSESSIPSTTKTELLTYIIKEANIGYRDSDDVAYARGDSAIGDYYLSADGWKESDTFDITLNTKGTIRTKLEGKVLYLYQYKATQVIWNNSVISQNEDKTYTLAKPATPGEYSLEIDFTKAMVNDPVELTSLNWSSILTVPNLMTILSWAVIVIGILVMYFLNRRYKKRGSTTLDEVEKCLSNEIENEWGVKVSDEVKNVFDTTIKTSFDAIDKKLSKVDSNQTVLVRCLLAMQENTPESRLAVTKLLTQLDTANDEESAKVKKLIEDEIQKRDSNKEAKEKALEEAKKTNAEWKAKADSESNDSEPASPYDDGTSI